MAQYKEGAPYGMLEVLSRASDKKIYTNVLFRNGQYASTGGWRGWAPIPGDFKANDLGPVAQYRVAGRSIDELEVFAIGEDGKVYTNVLFRDGRGWRGWAAIYGSLAPRILGDVAQYQVGGYDALEVFAIGPDNFVYSNVLFRDGQFSDRGGWRGWAKIPGNFCAKQLGGLAQYKYPGTAYDELEIFALGCDERVASNVLFRSSGWRGWGKIPGNFVAKQVGGVAEYAPSAPYHPLEVFAVDADGQVVTNVLFRDGSYSGSGGWRGWSRISSNFSAAAIGEVTQYKVGAVYDALEIFSLDMNGHVASNVLQRDGTPWRGWAAVQGAEPAGGGNPGDELMHSTHRLSLDY